MVSRRTLGGLGLLPMLPPMAGWAQSATLRAAYYDAFAPYSQRGEGGRMQGLFIDVVDELFGRRLRAGVVHEGYPWQRAQELVRQGRADVMITVPTPERLEYAVATAQWVTQGRFTMFIAADGPRRRELERLRGIDDLKGLSLGSYLGNGWVRSRFAGWRIEFASSRANALRMLLAGRFDVIVDSSNATQYEIQTLQLERRVIELSPVLESSETRVLVGKASPWAARVDEINQHLVAMRRDGTLARLTRPG